MNNTNNLVVGQVRNCRCKLCEENFDHQEPIGKFSSTVTGTAFDINNRDIDDSPPCKIDCVIYLITCSNCSMQYVGQTKKQLRYRVYNHRSSCKNKSEQILYKHFNSECKFENAKFRIIERTEESELLAKEDYWIKKVMSVYPFGLNDQIVGIGNMTRQNLIDFNFRDPFFMYPENRRPRNGIYNNRNRNRNKSNKQNIDEVIRNLKTIYEQNVIKKFVDAIKSTTNKLLLNILQKVLEHKNQFERRFIDIIAAYVGHSRKYRKEHESCANQNKIRVKINYSSKILDIINFSSLVSSKSVISKIPDGYTNDKIEIINSYCRPIGSRICNYNRLLENLSVDSINDNSPCVCERNHTHNKVREFIYSPVSHVVTGNINILDKLGNFEQLKRVMQYGYKYRIQHSNVTWRKIKRELMVATEKLKRRIAERNKGNINDLNDWEHTLKRFISNRIGALRNSHNLEQFRYGININLLNKQIANIHKHFVITNVDKASNNFAFICRKFYISKIKDELGIRGDRVLGNDVYAFVRDSSPQEIVNNQCQQLENLHRVVSEKNRTIPKLYMIPKFHKRPYKYRFIAGASSATTKKLSTDVNICLKLIKKLHKGYCKTIYNRNGFNYFWSVDNSKEALDKFNNVNNPASIYTYDFSTLYTNLPLDLVKKELFEMIDRYFDINERKNNKYIMVNQFFGTAQFGSLNKKDSYDRDKLKIALDYILFNSYVKFGPYVFKQIKGIPMGGNASPLIADLFLANLEFKYMDKLVSSKSTENLRLARKLSNNSRYIDDIAVCNMGDINEFVQCSKNIYPASIPLTSGNPENHRDTFLDLDVNIEDGSFVTKIYHKVDDFDFEVVSFPFITSNLSERVTYNSFFSQLFRFFTICTKYGDFANRSLNLLNTLLNRGYSKGKLKGCFNRFVHTYYDVVSVKYTMDYINRFVTVNFS